MFHSGGSVCRCLLSDTSVNIIALMLLHSPNPPNGSYYATETHTMFYINSLYIWHHWSSGWTLQTVVTDADGSDKPISFCLVHPHFDLFPLGKVDIGSWGTFYNFIKTLVMVFLFISLSVSCSCTCGRSWKLQRSTEAPFSHRKPCSWNASSGVSPLICDFVTSHYITMSQVAEFKPRS